MLDEKILQIFENEEAYLYNLMMQQALKDEEDADLQDELDKLDAESYTAALAFV